MWVAIRWVSSGASAGTFTGSSWPLTRSAGAAPTLKCTSEAPFFTAAARNWLKVWISIAPPRTARAPNLIGALSDGHSQRLRLREQLAGAAQTVGDGAAKRPEDLEREL